MIAGLLLAVCLSDPLFSATPALEWDPVPSVPPGGYRLYWSTDGGLTWNIPFDLPCEDCYDDEGLFCGWRCPGVDSAVAVHKYDIPECVPVTFAIRAVSAAGVESIQFSNTITIVPNHIWIKPEPYN